MSLIADLFYKPRAVKFSVESLAAEGAPDDDYNALAEKIGVVARHRVGSRLRTFLAESGIPAYSIEAVERYMDKKGRWGWFPLRQQDMAPSGKVWAWERVTVNNYPVLYGACKFTVYQQPVPYPVLLTVNSLVEQFGADVLFFVAAIDKHPDPFLGCMLRSEWGRMAVIERWDEPSFRDRNGK